MVDLQRLERKRRESVMWPKKAGIWAPKQLKMLGVVSLEFDGKTLGLAPSNLRKTMIARFFLMNTRSPSPGACNFHTASVKRRFHK